MNNNTGNHRTAESTHLCDDPHLCQLLANEQSNDSKPHLGKQQMRSTPPTCASCSPMRCTSACCDALVPFFTSTLTSAVSVVRLTVACVTFGCFSSSVFTCPTHLQAGNCNIKHQDCLEPKYMQQEAESTSGHADECKIELRMDKLQQ